MAAALPLRNMYSASVSVISGVTGASVSSKWGPLSATPRQCSTVTRMTSSIGAVKVTVSAAWFSIAPRPWTGTDAHSSRRAFGVALAPQHCTAKCISYSGRVIQ